MAGTDTRFYFAFPDRVYHYDCAACDALCCRGHGIGTAARETPGLLARYPELAWTVTKSTHQGANFTNPAGGCFFLTGDNLCRVERDHGREAKPGVCVAFPFNDFSRIGHIVVVRPHFLCPLRLLPGKGAGNHSEIEESLLDTGILPRALAQPGPDFSPEEARQAVLTEEAFRDKCGAAIGRISFDDMIEREAENAGVLRDWRRRALRLWGISSEPAPRGYLDDIVLALASPIRVRLLLLPERQRLRILYLAGAYLRNAARITDRPVTLQGAHHLLVNVLGVLRFFAYGNTSLPLPAYDTIEGVEFQDPRLTLAFFQVIEELQGGRKLLDVLEKTVPASLGGLDRAIFFYQLAKRVRELKRKGRTRA